MTRFEDGRVKKLDASLRCFGIAPDVVARIMEGGDTLTRTSSPVDRADWMREAMRRMDALVDIESRQAIREACACCLGGKRLAVSKSIARDNAGLDERIASANAARFVFGHSVTREDDRRVKVCFHPEGVETYRCPCLPHTGDPMSITYCYCCGGHVKHHLQIALGRRLNVTVVETALSTGGKRPCSFLFEFAD